MTNGPTVPRCGKPVRCTVCRLNLWAALHNEHPILHVDATFNVLRCAVKCLLHCPASFGDVLEQLLPVGAVRDHGHAVHALVATLVILCAHRLEQACTREALEVLAVAVRSEDEAVLRMQSDTFAEEGHQLRFASTPHREAHGSAREVSNKRLPPSGHELAVQLVLVVRERVDRMEHECVLRLDQFLNQDGHVQVVEASAGLRQGYPGPDGEERRPNALDGVPSITRVEQRLDPLLAILRPDIGHGLGHAVLQGVGHLHGVNQQLGLLEDELGVMVAGLGVQLGEHLLELRQNRVAVRRVGQRLLHATIGQCHRLWRQYVLGKLRLEQRQIQALRPDLDIVHLVRPDTPFAA
mmetsp:Transcript_68431/g.193257  ORF Transcript_68431/g.193257 Transcript_68431/m.193257 type:complete len:352 (+) Transcript_68431:34-1089(+)